MSHEQSTASTLASACVLVVTWLHVHAEQYLSPATNLHSHDPTWRQKVVRVWKETGMGGKGVVIIASAKPLANDSRIAAMPGRGDMPSCRRLRQCFTSMVPAASHLLALLRQTKSIYRISFDIPDSQCRTLSRGDYTLSTARNVDLCAHAKTTPHAMHTMARVCFC